MGKQTWKWSPTKRKAELLAKAERMIDELLGWEEEADQPAYVAIEGEMMKLRRQMDEAMVEDILREQASRKGKDVFERYGREMEHKGRQEHNISGWIGETKVKRAYCYCPQCRAGFFPLDRQLEIDGDCWSEAKQFKYRLTGAGMRWSRDGIEKLIPIRAAVMGDRFSQVWDQAKPIPGI